MSPIPDVYTGTGTVGFDQVAYDRAVYFPFRAQAYADQLANVQATNQSMPGSTVRFTTVTDLPVDTTPLSEAVDVDSQAIANAHIDVALAEYGEAVTTTQLLRATSYVGVNEVVANLIGENAGKTIDEIAMAQLEAGTNEIVAGGPLTPADIAAAVAELRVASAPTWDGSYAGLIHPYDSVDIRTAAGWVDPAAYSDANRIWEGEIGKFLGVRFMETPRAPVDTTTTPDTYSVLIMGRDALAKAYANVDGLGANPVVRQGPVIDKLSRFRTLGWYHLVGYGRFREDSLIRIETNPTLGV